MSQLAALARIGVVVAFAAAIGCEQQGPFEETGEAIDEAVEEAGDAIEEAGEDLEDIFDDSR